MSEAINRFAALLQLAGHMLAQAEHQDLKSCAPILAVYCSHHRSKFGEVPLSDSLELLASKTIDDGMEKIVGVLGTLNQEKGLH